MSEEEIKKFLVKLFEKKITVGYSTGTYNKELILEEGRDVFEGMLRGFLMENGNAELGELRAKVYAYEKIIANSNFAPLIANNENGKKCE